LSPGDSGSSRWKPRLEGRPKSGLLDLDRFTLVPPTLRFRGTSATERPCMRLSGSFAGQ
jgi:hypothetical protein